MTYKTYTDPIENQQKSHNLGNSLSPTSFDKDLQETKSEGLSKKLINDYSNSSPAKSFKERVEELEKGCGKEIDIISYGYVNCGEWYNNILSAGDDRTFLCPVCQAKLKALKEGYDLKEKENKEIIDKYCKLDNPTSFDLFKVFADITKFNIKDFHDKLTEQLKTNGNK